MLFRYTTIDTAKIEKHQSWRSKIWANLIQLSSNAITVNASSSLPEPVFPSYVPDDIGTIMPKPKSAINVHPEPQSTV